MQLQGHYSIFGACKTIVCLQIFLKTEAGQKELDRWPQYEGCLVPAYGGKRIQLNTLQYFLLWTAFYVLRTAHASSSDIMGPRPSQTTRLGHFKQVELQCLCSLSGSATQPTPASLPLAPHAALPCCMPNKPSIMLIIFCAYWQ